MITAYEAAQQLNGNEYRAEGSDELFAQMKEAGLVAVFGASDDLVEFRGAIYDETGLSNIYLTKDGILYSKCECGDECPYFEKEKECAYELKVYETRGEFYFSYSIDVPYEPFHIYEDGENYCRGIVFNLKDLE